MRISFCLCWTSVRRTHPRPYRLTAQLQRRVCSPSPRPGGGSSPWRAPRKIGAPGRPAPGAWAPTAARTGPAPSASQPVPKHRSDSCCVAQPSIAYRAHIDIRRKHRPKAIGAMLPSSVALSRAFEHQSSAQVYREHVGGPGCRQRRGSASPPATKLPRRAAAPGAARISGTMGGGGAPGRRCRSSGAAMAARPPRAPGSGARHVRRRPRGLPRGSSTGGERGRGGHGGRGGRRSGGGGVAAFRRESGAVGGCVV